MERVPRGVVEGLDVVVQVDGVDRVQGDGRSVAVGDVRKTDGVVENVARPRVHRHQIVGRKRLYVGESDFGWWHGRGHHVGGGAHVVDRVAAHDHIGVDLRVRQMRETRHGDAHVGCVERLNNVRQLRTVGKHRRRAHVCRKHGRVVVRRIVNHQAQKHHVLEIAVHCGISSGSVDRGIEIDRGGKHLARTRGHGGSDIVRVQISSVDTPLGMIARLLHGDRFELFRGPGARETGHVDDQLGAVGVESHGFDARVGHVAGCEHLVPRQRDVARRRAFGVYVKHGVVDVVQIVQGFGREHVGVLDDVCDWRGQGHGGLGRRTGHADPV